MSLFEQLPFEVLSQIFHLLHPFNDLQSIALIPQLRPYLSEILCFISDTTKPKLLANAHHVDNFIIEYKGQDYEEFKELIKQVKGTNHRVLYQGSSFPIGFFNNELFQNDQGLEGVHFDNVLRIGRDNWFEMFGDQFFHCFEDDSIVFKKCQEMRIGLQCRGFPMEKVHVPNLQRLDLKIINDQVSLDFLKNMVSLKELRISTANGYGIMGFRFLELKNLQVLVLDSQRLEFGFYGCNFPKLKKLDITRLKEIWIVLDTRFDELEELDLSCTKLIFPIYSKFLPKLRYLNVQNHHESNSHMTKLKMNELINLERIDLSSFDYLIQNPKLLDYLNEVHFKRDVSINRNFEVEEIERLMTLQFKQLKKIVIHLYEPGEYDFERINSISPLKEQLEVKLIVDGVEEQFKLKLASSALNVETIFSPQRKKRKSV